MYKESAKLYDELFEQRDYAQACETVDAIVRRYVPDAASLLDVACGTGRHLEHFRKRYTSEGVDISREMLEIAQERCPGVLLHERDFTDFDLGRQFDVVVCLFASIGYATSVDQMNDAVKSMATHVRPRGVLLVEPWVTPEAFVVGKLVMDVVDEPNLKVSRMYISQLRDRTSVYDVHYLVGHENGVSHFIEHEELGLFTRQEMLDAFRRAGLEVLLEDESGLFGYGFYVARASPDTR